MFAMTRWLTLDYHLAPYGPIGEVLHRRRKIVLTTLVASLFIRAICASRAPRVYYSRAIIQTVPDSAVYGFLSTPPPTSESLRDKVGRHLNAWRERSKK